MTENHLRDSLIGKDVKEIDRYGSLPSTDYSRPSLHDLTTREFYRKEGWLEGMCETLFKIRARRTTINSEVYNGVIHFISCLYCLAVVPQQLSAAGYDSNNTVVSVALCVGVSSICCGLFANLPFVLAPPTVVTIFLSVFLQENNMGPREGNIAVMLSGVLMMFFGWRPLGEIVRRLIPVPIQVGTVVGVGLLTTLAGSTEVSFVVPGHYKILRMGHITPEIVIVFAGVIIICVAMRYHVKGSFCLAVVLCSMTYWIYDRSFPDQIFALPTITTANFDSIEQSHMPLLTIDLLFLYVLYLNGLVNSLTSLAALSKDDGATPRGRWIFILSGFFTIIGGLLTSAPILVSPESSAAIKEGAKTGLSTVVCGVLFLFSAFLGPLFQHIPAAGTSPVLIMIGVILFQNVNRVDWRNVADAAPAFVVLFYIPFTYSIIQGVILGYIMYLSITLCTGELLENTLCLFLICFPQMEERLLHFNCLRPYLLGQSGYRAAATQEGDLASPTAPVVPSAQHSPILKTPFSPAKRCSPQVSPRSHYVEKQTEGLDSGTSSIQQSRERRASRLHAVDVPFIPILSTTTFLSGPSPGPDNGSRRLSRADCSSVQAEFSTGFEPEFLNPNSSSDSVTDSKRQSATNVQETAGAARSRNDSGNRYSAEL